MTTRLLFVCVGNTCRSPMAEAFVRHLGRGPFVAQSAGRYPTGRVEEKTLWALQRLGVPCEGLASKGFDAVDLDSVDLVVSLAGPGVLRELPLPLQRSAIVWSIRDPYGEERAVYLAVARVIAERVHGLLEELGGAELSGI
jgi:arsenate reductase